MQCMDKKENAAFGKGFWGEQHWSAAAQGQRKGLVGGVSENKVQTQQKGIKMKSLKCEWKEEAGNAGVNWE